MANTAGNVWSRSFLPLLPADQLSEVLIDQTPYIPSSTAYRNRFGSLALAYEIIGYRSIRDQERVTLNKRLRWMYPEIDARTEAAIAKVGGVTPRPIY